MSAAAVSITSADTSYAENSIIAIDATIGNGNDTLFLARLVGNSGHVYGFDIQQDAIDITGTLLTQHQLKQRVTLHHCGHEQMAETLQQHQINHCAFVMFNLGYLPRGDKSISTRPATSVIAIRQALSLLDPDGLISIIVYPGHPAGEEETDVVRDLIHNLASQHYQTQRYASDSKKTTSPELFIIKKQ